MTDGLPSRAQRPPDELAQLERAWRTPRGWRFFTTVNNTNIGRLYIGTALLFFVLAGVLALLMRLQLAQPGNTLLAPGTYNQVFTMHGTVMMFLFAIPVVEAFAVYLLPNMLGARDLPFPRLSAYAYWAYALGGIAFFCTLFAGVAPDGGWFMYPPLTGKAYSPGAGADFWLLGIGFIEISAIAGAIELIVGILFTRAPGMTLSRMPVYAWAMLVVGVMIVLAFPAVIAGTALLELERAWDWPFFIAERGGDPVMWQHLFWFFGHPEVYIIFLPAAGMVSTMLPALAGTRLAGRRAVIASLAVTGTVSFALWAHHMFAAGLGRPMAVLVSAASMVVALPASVQVAAWIATLWRGAPRWNAPLLFIAGFLVLFTLGGLTGVMVAALPFDWQAHDTYFIVAHLHYVLIGGMLFPVFAAMYYWFPLLHGHCLPEQSARWIFGLMFGGFNLAFFPMHIVGLLGMPRRVYTYAGDLGWSGYNMASTIGALVFAAGVLWFCIDVVRTLRRPGREKGNPWRASTLEWLPAEDYGNRSIAQVYGEEPLWEQPSLAQEVAQGRHWLPGTATGRRETMVATWRDARPWYLLLLPGDSWWPPLAALGTAGFFLLLTVQQAVAAWLCGFAAIGAVLKWLWQLDRPPAMAAAQVADSVALPVGGAPLGAHGRRAWHAWWAMVILLVVDGAIFASFIYVYLHVGGLLAVCPPPGAGLPDRAARLLACGLFGAASAAMVMAGRSRGVSGRGGMPPADAHASCLPLALWIALALLCAVAGIAAGVGGLDWAPVRSAWHAGAAVLAAYAWLHALLLAVLACYLWARAGAGLLTAESRASLDCCALAWHVTGAQGICLMLVL
ncbi:cytochrome ubiquinol oxidase subunit I [Duganella sp. FT92W]|uniref:Cytochrome ubiquinol oxidase subunit I n=1 Tax=Pseudoduganella rivuli TaxID=2666085 RepID=A0A7X2LV67_9BURK|nr:cbb3-type cytochrome c oxidase subunit I [Pseudoduganella rivuli]MRV73619.1 cytochrome ubiquinol oxidase subunit I [Pseudoduganella rivuli]